MPVGFHIASAWVDIRANDTGLRTQVMEMVKKAVAGQEIKIPVRADAKNLRTEVNNAIRRATAGQKATIKAAIDSRGLRAELNRALRAATAGNRVQIPVSFNSVNLRNELNRALRAASAGQRVSVPVHISNTALRNELNRALAAAKAGQSVRVPIKLNNAGFRAAVSAAIANAARGQAVHVPIKLNTAGFRAAVSAACRAAGAGQAIRVPLRVDSRAMRTAVRNAVRGAAAGQRINIPVHADARGLRGEVSRAVRAAGAGQRIHVRVNADTNGLRRAGRDVRSFGRSTTSVFSTMSRFGMRAFSNIANVGGGAFRSISSSAPLMAAAAIAAFMAIGAAGAGAAAIIAAALPVAFIGIGLAAQATKTKWKDTMKEMGQATLKFLRDVSSPLKKFIGPALDYFKKRLQEIKPLFKTAFAAVGPLIKPLIKGLTLLAERAMPGINRALQRSKPIMDGFAKGLGLIGKGLGQFFDNLTRGNGKNLGKIWEVLGEGIRKVLSATGQMLADFSKDPENVKTLQELFDLIAALLRSLPIALRLFHDFFNLLRGNPFPLLKDAWNFFTHNKLVLGIKDGVTHIARDVIWPLLQKIGKFVGHAAVWVADHVTAIAKGAWNWLKKIGGFIAHAAIWVADHITSIAKGAWNWIKRFAGWVGRAAIWVADHITGIAKGAWNWIKRFAGWVGKAAIWVADHVSGLAKKAWNWIKGFAGWVGRAAIWVADHVSGLAKKAWNWIKGFAGWVGRAAIWVADHVSGLAKKAWNWIKGFAGWVGRAAIWVADHVTGLAKRAWSWIKRFAGWVGKAAIWVADHITSIAKRAWSWIKKFAGWVGKAAIHLKDGVTGLAKRAWGWIKKIAGFVGRAVINVVDNVTKIVKGAVKWLGKLVSKTITIGIDIIGKGAKGILDKIGSFLGFAEGGVIQFATGGVVGYADGGTIGGRGAVEGPGNGKSDSILARVSNGEFVMSAAVVKKYGVDFMNAINSGRMPEFAEGGTVAGPKGGSKGGGAAFSAVGSALATGFGAPAVASTAQGKKSTTAKSGDDTLVKMVQVIADTSQIDPKIIKTQQLLNSLEVPKPVALTAVDNTTSAINTAKSNFSGLGTVANTAYNTLKLQTTTFGTQMNASMQAMKTRNQMTWDQWRLGMQSRSTAAYQNIHTATTTWGNSQNQTLQGVRTAQHTIWQNWQTGMRSRSNTTFESIKNSTSAWGNGMNQRVQGVRTAQHTIWQNWENGMRGRSNQTFESIKNSTSAWGNGMNSRVQGVRNAQHSIWQNWENGMRSRSNQTFESIKNATSGWGNGMNSRVQGVRNAQHSIWQNWENGMRSRTNQTYESIKNATSGWGNGMNSRLGGVRNAQHSIWQSWDNGLRSKTNSTYTALKNSTSAFGTGMNNRFKQIRDNVGNSWNGVRPKLASPIKYLINNVINKGVIPAMNSVVNQLGGSGNLKSVSAGGFATGGYVRGPGSSTSDSIPARLSNGEFVMKASAVRKYGIGTMRAMNAGMMSSQTGAVQKFSGGGPVSMSVGVTPGFAGGGLVAVTKAGESKINAILGDDRNYNKLADWIWDEVIDPLLGKAPGGPAMKKVLNAAGALMRKNADDWLSVNDPWLAAGNGFTPFRPWQPGDEAHVNYRGVQVNKRTKEMLAKAEGIYKHPFSAYQGSWSGAAASAGTHTGGGAVDVGPAQDPVVGAMRASGFAAWRRTPAEGFSPHVHGIAVGDPTVSPAAKVQVQDFFKGLNGLANKGPDTYLGGGAGGGVKRWAGAVNQALREAGQSLANAGKVLNQMQHESGGNPRAVNLTDINAKRGTPSVGLMQVIKPTFQAYAGKYKNAGPFMYGVSISPVPNIYSSIKYVLARYGSIARGMTGKAYASGGPVSGPGTTTSDSINARLSNGEYVVQASAVRHYGLRFMEMINGGKGFAGGGMMTGCFHSGGMYRHGGSTSSGTYTVKSGDTLSEIAERFHTSVDKLVRLNEIGNKDLIRIGQTLRISERTGSDTQDYLIKWGDTLTSIAKKFNTSVAELARMNNISNPDRIFAGTHIRVPGGGPGGVGHPGDVYQQHPNQAYIPGFGWVDIPQTSKYYTVAELSGENLKESPTDEMHKARADLIGQTQIGPYGQMAGEQLPKIVYDLGKNETLNGLIQAMYELKSEISLAGFDAGDQKWLLDKLNASAGLLFNYQRQLEGVNAQLQTAQEALDGLNSQFDSLKESVSQNIVQFGTITKIGKYGTNPNVLIGQLQSDVSKATEFAGQLESLRNKGLNAQMISDIAAAGISNGGMATAASILLMSPEQIAQLNALQDELTKQANAAGTSVANAMYKAGIDAAQGLVDGLNSQKAQIQKLMMDIAVAMENAIKVSLGIKSPSKVMAKVGEFTAMGLVEGMDSKVKDIMGSVYRMGEITTTSLPSTGETISEKPKTPHVCGPEIVINKLEVSVNGTFDLTRPAQRRNIAKALVTEIKEEIRSNDRAYK